MRLSAMLILAAAAVASSKPVDSAPSIMSSISNAIAAPPSPPAPPVPAGPAAAAGPSGPALPSKPPTVVIAPGAWHQPTVYEALRTELGLLAYPSISVALPSVGAKDPNVGMQADAARIRTELTRQADQGNNVILVAHSYAGVPASTAVAGLSVKDRVAAGKKGGVVGVLYLCAFVLPAQVSLSDALGGQFPAWFNVTGQVMNPIDPARVFYNDLSDQATVAWAVSQLRSENVKIVTESNTFQPWSGGIPVGYVYTTQDNAVPLSMQQSMTAGFAEDAFKATMNTGHAPFLSQPNALAANIKAAAVQFAASK
ncbi:uncharacterized protein PpBr36_10094 [Pyricularia pennisetigena]|uniref:uncharacterized protein n=1 Tax=Pyricularia pennisetigena TaxID=1578925 RepID=UPI00114FC550|nr:uncharacterized protein PpBr36_10094 [Pyricularia pennisetigena]TLS22148.1 hypothetical protein PpBr36_10094 [Pyricularia pennisetigena]